MDIKKVVFDNNADLLRERQRGVDPEVLEDIGIHPYKVVEEGGRIAFGSQAEMMADPKSSTRSRSESQKKRASNDIANAAAEQKPFPYGYADIDDYR